MYYWGLQLSEDEETQRRGTVMVFLAVNEDWARGLDFDLHHRASSSLDCLPVKIKAVHLCTDNPHFKALNLFKFLFLRVSGERLRTRFRLHVGTLL